MESSYIEVLVGYKPEGEAIDYENLGIDTPDDYEPEFEPTLIRVDRIESINPSDEPDMTTIRVDGGMAYNVGEPYMDVRDKMKKLCQIM